MLLVIDIGNSRTKTGLFDKGQLIKTALFDQGKFDLGELSTGAVDAAAVSSVVPEGTENIVERLKSINGPKPFLLNHNSIFNLSIDYKSPEKLGLDRLCGAEAALAFVGSKYNKNSIILTIDFGTATTINVVEYQKKFVGGIILPGIQLMNKSLNQFTKQLLLVDFNNYKELIGKSTEEAISSGIINSTISIIEKVISNYSNKNVYPFITGGNAELILPYLDFEYQYEKDLVLYGIERIYKANQ